MLKNGLVLIALPLLFQLVFVAILLRSQADSRAARLLAIHSREVIERAEAVSRYLHEVQGETARAVIADDSRLSAEADPIAVEAEAALSDLHELVQGNPEQHRRVVAIAAAARKHLAWQAENRRLVENGRTPEAEARIRTLRGKHGIDAIRDQLDEFLAEESRLDELRSRAVHDNWRWQRRFTLAGLVLSVLMAVGLVSLFSRTFARRVNELVENARRLAAGRPMAPPTADRDELGEIDRAFHAMARTLAERDQENELFIYSVSHDLRSPLVNLQGFSKELALTADDLRAAVHRTDLDESQRRSIERLLDDMPQAIQFIQSAVLRLSGIIDALLRLSRAGRVEYRRQDVDLAVLVDRVIEAASGSIARAGAIVNVPDRLPMAHGDPTALEQVFGNLIGNAINYLDPSRPGRIEVGTLDDGQPDAAGLITVYVRDNGMGIASDHLAKLFQAFQRLHPDAAPGEGIGLTLVRRIVERHGGQIRVESQPGVGSTFFFTLPAAQTDEATPDRLEVPALTLR